MRGEILVGAERQKVGIASSSNGPKPELVKRLEQLDKQIRACVQCPLHCSRTLAVPGEGKATAKVMIIGEAPGKTEDETGRPFVGSAGKFLDHVLAGIGYEGSDFLIHMS